VAGLSRRHARILYRNFKPSGVLEAVTLVTVEIVCRLG